MELTLCGEALLRLAAEGERRAKSPCPLIARWTTEARLQGGAPSPLASPFWRRSSIAIREVTVGPRESAESLHTEVWLY